MKSSKLKHKIRQNERLASFGLRMYFSFLPSFRQTLGPQDTSWARGSAGLAAWPFSTSIPDLGHSVTEQLKDAVLTSPPPGWVSLALTHLPKSSEGVAYWTRSHRDWMGCWQQDTLFFHRSEIPVVLGQFPKTSRAEKEKQETKMFLNNLEGIFRPRIQCKEQNKSPPSLVIWVPALTATWWEERTDCRNLSWTSTHGPLYTHTKLTAPTTCTNVHRK